MDVVSMRRGISLQNWKFCKAGRRKCELCLSGFFHNTAEYLLMYAISIYNCVISSINVQTVLIHQLSCLQINMLRRDLHQKNWLFLIGKTTKCTHVCVWSSSIKIMNNKKDHTEYRGKSLLLNEYLANSKYPKWMRSIVEKNLYGQSVIHH